MISEETKYILTFFSGARLLRILIGLLQDKRKMAVIAKSDIFFNIVCDLIVVKREGVFTI
jgi:glucuronate isomerase